MHQKRLHIAFPIALILSGVTVLPASAAAEMAFSLYGGYQSAPHSDVEVDGMTDFAAGWEGKSFSWPIYWGARGTWWLDSFDTPNLGVSLDFSHSKVYADDETLQKTGWSHFEFSDGLNLLTVNALYRFPMPEAKLTPYVGIGAGINVPHVEVTRPSGTTYGYQFGGPTLQAQAGLSYSFAKNWDAFVEYKANYSWIDVDLDGGDRMKSNILTNAVNLGVSFHF